MHIRSGPSHSAQLICPTGSLLGPCVLRKDSAAMREVIGEIANDDENPGCALEAITPPRTDVILIFI